MSAERPFLDTNVLVYLFCADAPAKQARSRELLEAHLPAGTAMISTQVLQEFYVVVTRRISIPLSPTDAARAIRNLLRLPTVAIDGTLILNAIDVADRFRLSFWDALIVRAARTAGADVLYTEDLTHGEVVDGMRIVNPFHAH